MGEEFKAIGILLLMFAPLYLPKLIKWLWTHPHVNARKMRDNITEAKLRQDRLDAAQELRTDLALKSLERYNIRAKGITVTWTDNINNREKTLNFLIDGKGKTSKALIELAKAVEEDTRKNLMRTVYKLPKRHGKDECESIVHIHGLTEQ